MAPRVCGRSKKPLKAHAPFFFFWLAGAGAAVVLGCSEGVPTGVSPPPGLAEPSLELLSFLRCSRFSLLLTLVSHVPEEAH